MKTIPRPQLDSAQVLTPAQMNTIHFGGNHSPLPPEPLKAVGSQR